MLDNVSGQEWPILTVTEPQHLQSGVDVLGKGINPVLGPPVHWLCSVGTDRLFSQHRHTDSGIWRRDTSKAQSFAADAVSLAASEFNLAASCISLAACDISLAASSLASCGVFEGWGFCEETC